MITNKRSPTYSTCYYQNWIAT